MNAETTRARKLIFVLFSILAAFSGPLTAEGYRIIFMIDHSGSMRETDPGESRISAASSLLGRPDLYSSQGRQDTIIELSLIHIGNRYPGNDNPLDFDVSYTASQRDEIKAQVERSLREKLNSRTDIYGAMKKALRKAEQTRGEGLVPVVLLITDGEIDLDGEYGEGTPLNDQERAERERAIGLAADLGALGTRIYVLEVPGVRDSELLAAIAAASHQDEEAAPNLFSIDMSLIPNVTGKIADDLWNLHEVPVIGSKFPVGDLVGAFLLDIILDVETQGDRDLRRDLQPKLVAPGGIVIDAEALARGDFGDQIEMTASRAFVQFQVVLGGDLRPGEWEFQAAEDLAYLIRPTVDSRVKLELQLEDSTFFVGQTVPVYCDVTFDNEELSRELADDVKITVTLSTDGKEVAGLDLHDSGQSRHQDAEKGDARFSNKLRLTDVELRPETAYQLVARLDLASASSPTALLSDPRLIRFETLDCDNPGVGNELISAAFDESLGIKKGKRKKLDRWLNEGDHERLRKKTGKAIAAAARKKKAKKRIAGIALRSLVAETYVRERAFDQGKRSFIELLRDSAQILDDLTRGESEKLEQLLDLVDRQASYSRRQVECVKCSEIEAEIQKAEAGKKKCAEVRDRLDEFSAYGCQDNDYPTAAARRRACDAEAQSRETDDSATQPR